MARVLIVGWDGRGGALAAALRERGHLVRGAAGEADGPAIEDAGAEAVGADPDRLGTLLTHLQGVSAVCWLAGDSPRLEALVETLIDTHARGLVCDPGPGAEAAREAAARNNVGFETASDPAAMAAALDRILAIHEGPRGA
jgi:prephenate dehydrogenase